MLHSVYLAGCTLQTITEIPLRRRRFDGAVPGKLERHLVGFHSAAAARWFSWAAASCLTQDQLCGCKRNSFRYSRHGGKHDDVTLAMAVRRRHHRRGERGAICGC